MFWELAPGDVIGKPVNTQCPKVMNAWKMRKCKMQKPSRSYWIQYEHSPRAMQLREYTLKEFWEIFVDDRPQSKAVFSCAMTLTDAACVWIYRKEALTGGQKLDREQEEHLKQRIMSIMLCTNWVCEGAFVNHEWVTSRTIFQQEEEILSMVLIFKIDVPCVVQWCLLWFSAPTDLNRILETKF